MAMNMNRNEQHYNQVKSKLKSIFKGFSGLLKKGPWNEIEK